MGLLWPIAAPLNVLTLAHNKRLSLWETNVQSLGMNFSNVTKRMPNAAILKNVLGLCASITAKTETIIFRKLILAKIFMIRPECAGDLLESVSSFLERGMLCHSIPTRQLLKTLVFSD